MPSELRLFTTLNKPRFTTAVVDFDRRRVWALWFLAMAVAFTVQLLTLDVLPHLQQDEAQITDYGRLALNPDSDWSVTWRVAEEKPFLLWSYVGPLIAELGYQLSGPSGLGPRLAALIGGMAAALAAFGWLLARMVPVYAAFGLSFAFMIDPLFVLSQRMARVDSWVIAFCLGCCWLLREATAKKNNSSYRWYLMAAGGLAALAALVWPSAIFLYPLILLEFFHHNKESITGSNKLKLFATKALYFFIGGVTAFVLLLVPVWQNLLIILNDVSAMVSHNVDASKSPSDRLLILFNHHAWIKLTKAFIKTFTPLFPLFALAGIVIHRDWKLIVASTAALALIFASLVYEFRALYLMPYFLGLASCVFVHMQGGVTLKQWGRKAATYALSTLVLWAVGTSLLVRTALGIENRANLDQDRILQVAESSIGRGNYKVFLGFTYEFYFVGRSLGWQLYTPYIQFSYDSEGNWIRENDYKPRGKFLQLLSQMDYAVFPQGAVNDSLKNDLSAAGLFYSSTFSLGNNYNHKEQPQLKDDRAKFIFLWFLQGKTSYGSYTLYRRQQSKNVSLGG